MGVKLGANIIPGASNVSHVLPDRLLVNQAFLALAISAGATYAITDPMKMTDLLLGAISNTIANNRPTGYSHAAGDSLTESSPG